MPYRSFSIIIYYDKPADEGLPIYTAEWHVGLRILDLIEDSQNHQIIEETNLPFMNAIHATLAEDGFKTTDPENVYRDWRLNLTKMTRLRSPVAVGWEMLRAQRNGTLMSYVPSVPIPPLILSGDMEYVVGKIQRVMEGLYVLRDRFSTVPRTSSDVEAKEIHLRYSGPLPQAIKNLMPWGVAKYYETLGLVKIVKLGTSLTLQEFKKLGKNFRIEKKLIYDNYLADENDVGCGFELAKNIQFPVRTGPQSSQIFCVSDLVKWIQMGRDKDPGNNEPITSIHVMDENDIAEQEWKDCQIMRETLLAKLKSCQNKRKEAVSNDVALKLRKQENKLMGQLNNIPATRRALTKKKLERTSLDRVLPHLKF